MKSKEVSNQKQKTGGDDANAAKQSRSASWDKDHADPSKTSMAILLDWLTEQGNWTKYRGGPGNNGKTKGHYAQQIIKRFEEAGVQSTRHINQVTKKICELEQSYRKAVDFLANTGSGLESPGDIDEEKFKRCKYYDILAPILGERGASRPLATNHTTCHLDGYNAFCIDC